MFKTGFLVVVFVAVTLALTGCGKNKVWYGEAIPDNVKVVKLKAVLEAPKEYEDKEVVLEGNFGGVCSTSCATDFNYKEGLERVEVYPKGFATPKLDKGKPIRVYGVVRSIEKKTESKEEKEEERHEVYIEAKGVEVR